MISDGYQYSTIYLSKVFMIDLAKKMCDVLIVIIFSTKRKREKKDNLIIRAVTADRKKPQFSN